MSVSSSDIDSNLTEAEPIRDPTHRYVQESSTLFYRSTYKRLYRAYDIKTGLEVAWSETLLWDCTDSDFDEIDQSLSILTTVRHPSLVTYMSHWLEREKSMLVVIREYMYGVTLKSFVETRGIPRLPIALRWAKQILSCFSSLHALSPPICYRALQSDNVYIRTSVGSVKLSTLRSDKVTKHIPPSARAISPNYAAPEYYHSDCTVKSDIFSFGMFLLFLLTGKESYHDVDEPSQIEELVRQGQLPSILNTVSVPELHGIISQCLSVDPDARPTAIGLLAQPIFSLASPSMETQDDSQPPPTIFPTTLQMNHTSPPRRDEETGSNTRHYVFEKPEKPSHSNPHNLRQSAADLTKLYVMLSDDTFMNFVDGLKKHHLAAQTQQNEINSDSESQTLHGTTQNDVSRQIHNHHKSLSNPPPSSSESQDFSHPPRHAPHDASADQPDISPYLAQLHTLFRSYQRLRHIDLGDTTSYDISTAPPRLVKCVDKLEKLLSLDLSTFLVSLWKNKTFMQNLHTANDLALVNPRQPHQHRHRTYRPPQAVSSTTPMPSRENESPKGDNELKWLLGVLKDKIDPQALTTAIHETIVQLDKHRTPPAMSVLVPSPKPKQKRIESEEPFANSSRLPQPAHSSSHARYNTSPGPPLLLSNTHALVHDREDRFRSPLRQKHNISEETPSPSIPFPSPSPVSLQGTPSIRPALNMLNSTEKNIRQSMLNLYDAYLDMFTPFLTDTANAEWYNGIVQDAVRRVEEVVRETNEKITAGLMKGREEDNG
ncbi:putative serine/threonine protein kinase [Blattamonas nauphoetae]|uniref:Serine/threonine protein kinase n=1 Tax=Blattamonas nauphoetae TaxID=2049346 RepID=A0ABQ9Y6L8_9EUKA|nr:putative serine/threonine protein kinase [Blattamonas nauphoetae]